MGSFSKALEMAEPIAPRPPVIRMEAPSNIGRTR
jgi:hypothetical protein